MVAIRFRRRGSDGESAAAEMDGQNPGRSDRREAAGLAPPVSARRDQRRPRRVAAGVVLLVICGLLGWFAWSQVSTTESVVSVRDTIDKGSVITRDQLTTAQVNGDSGLRVVPVSRLDSLVGKRAATDLPAGSIVPGGSAMSGPVAEEGESVVGVLIRPGAAPVTGLEPGARVRLLALASAQGQEQAPAPDSGGSEDAALEELQGLIVRVKELPDGSGTSVDVAVDTDAAAQMQRLSAANRVAIVVDSER